MLNAIFGTLIGAVAAHIPPARQRADAGQRRADGVSRHPAGDRHHRRARARRPSTPCWRWPSSISRAPPASCAPRCIVLREMEYVQAAVAAGAGHWRILRRHILPNAHGAADRAAFLPVRLRRAGRGDAELPRRRRGAADADLGQHHGRGPAVHARGAVDHHHPRGGADDHRAGPQHAGRRAARRARSAAEDPAVSLLEVRDLTTAFATAARRGDGGRGRQLRPRRGRGPRHRRRIRQRQERHRADHHGPAADAAGARASSGEVRFDGRGADAPCRRRGMRAHPRPAASRWSSRSR